MEKVTETSAEYRDGSKTRAKLPSSTLFRASALFPWNIRSSSFAASPEVEVNVSEVSTGIWLPLRISGKKRPWGDAMPKEKESF